jgi:hypothetical protein
MVGPRTEHWRPRWCFGPLWMLAPEYLILSPCEHRGRGKTMWPKEMVSGAKRCGTPLYHYHLPPWMVLFAPTTMDTWQESSNPKLFPSSGMIVSRGGWVVGCQIQNDDPPAIRIYCGELGMTTSLMVKVIFVGILLMLHTRLRFGTCVHSFCCVSMDKMLQGFVCIC